MRSLELLLDDAAEAAVLEQWRRLDQADLPSLARHPGATNRPHVTLDARDHPAGDQADDQADDPADGVEDETGLADVAARLPVAVALGGPLLFASRRGWVLVRHVVVTRELLDLHLLAQDRLAQDRTGGGSSPLTATGSWVPHVSLARGLDHEQVARALAVVADDPPVAAAGVRLRRWDSVAARVWLL